MPGQEGRDDLSLRQGEPVHVPEVPGPPQGLRDSSLGGAHGGVLGQRLGFSRSTPRSRTRESTEWYMAGIEVFSPEAFVECEDDQGCGGDGGDGCGAEGDVS